MAINPLYLLVLPVLSVTACDSAAAPSAADAGTSNDGLSISADASNDSDGSIDSDAGTGTDSDGATQTANVSEAFSSCTNPGPAGGVAGGDELIRIDVDTNTFPKAVCNDGTGAVMYVRRATNATHMDKWVVQLQGGGSCGDASRCAKRWCSVDTNFGARKMSNQFAPEGGINGRGVLSNRGDNPFSGWNHVFVYYCSSDGWSGAVGPVDLAAPHPVSGGSDAPYRIEFNGSHIVEAVTDTLRQDGVGPVTYVDSRSTTTQLPDLDDASMVVLAGASAGGGGVINNLDRFAASLRATNSECSADNCPLQVVGIVDSIFAPSMRNLGLTETRLCSDDGLCTAEQYQQARHRDINVGLWQARGDESCVTWNNARATGETHWCSDKNFVLENHLTTPYVLRMGLTDQLISGNMITARFTVPAHGDALLSVRLFARIVAEQLEALPSAVASGNESAAVTRAPGVFGPPCPGHETLSNSGGYFDVTTGTPPMTFPQLIANWLAQSGPTIAIASSITDTSGCQ